MPNRRAFILSSIAAATAPAILSQANAGPEDSPRPSESAQKLIRGATVISMDPKIGDVLHADILIEGDRIAIRKLGVSPALGVDLESGLSGDMFTVARMALNMQRALDNATSRAERGAIPDTSSVRTREALEWATMSGARMLGIEDRLGSITPGKQADLVILDARLLNMQPVLDPINTVVTQTGIVNVEAVLIAGQFRKRDGRLLYPRMQECLRQLNKSGRRIAGALGILT